MNIYSLNIPNVINLCAKSQWWNSQYNDNSATWQISWGSCVFSSTSLFWGQRTRQEKHDGKYRCFQNCHFLQMTVKPVTLLASIARILHAFEEWEENDTTFSQRMEDRAHHPQCSTPFCVCSEMFWSYRRFQSFRGDAGSRGHPASFTGRSKCRCWSNRVTFSVADSWTSFPLIFTLSKAFKTPQTSNLFIPNGL